RIVNRKNKIVGAGYNDLPIGLHDHEFPWGKEGEFLDTKYTFVYHAELNAILNNNGMDLGVCKSYIALFSVIEFVNAIIQAGITEVVYLSDKYNGNHIVTASKKMLESAGVSYRKVETRLQDLTLSFRSVDV